VDENEYVIGTCLVSYPRALPVPKLAPALAIEQSTGTWVPVPGEIPEARRKHVAKVVGIYEISDYEWMVPLLPVLPIRPIFLISGSQPQL